MIARKMAIQPAARTRGEWEGDEIEATALQAGPLVRPFQNPRPLHNHGTRLTKYPAVTFLAFPRRLAFEVRTVRRDLRGHRIERSEC